MRWLFHIATSATWSAFQVDGSDAYTAPSLATEGFIHCSYRDAVTESARLYFPKDASLVVLRIDPRALTAPVVVANTPRGPMPHVHGAIPRAAVRAVSSLADFDREADSTT